MPLFWNHIQKNYWILAVSTYIIKFSPLLFLVYINDIEQCELSSKVEMYADDMSLTTSSPDPMTLEFKLNSDLEKIQNWSHSSKLILNVKKTKYAIIGSRYKLNNLNHDFIVSVDNREIERVTSYKYLRVEIDQTLSWRYWGHKKGPPSRA